MQFSDLFNWRHVPDNTEIVQSCTWGIFIWDTALFHCEYDIMLHWITMEQGRRHGGGGRGKGRMPPKGFKKGKIRRLWVFFMYIGVIKISFSFILTRKYMLWEGFYYHKRASASGGKAPWPPPRGHCPLDPQGYFAPSNGLPWCHPCNWIWSSLYENASHKGLQNLCYVAGPRGNLCMEMSPCFEKDEIDKYDTIKRNESHVANIQFWFFNINFLY